MRALKYSYFGQSKLTFYALDGSKTSKSGTISIVNPRPNSYFEDRRQRYEAYRRRDIK